MNKTNEISNHHHNSQSRKEEILLLIMLLPTDKQGLAYESFMASVKRLFTALLESRHYDMWREFFTDAVATARINDGPFLAALMKRGKEIDRKVTSLPKLATEQPSELSKAS